MPQLPFVCLSCKRVYKRVDVSRPVMFGETAGGICPTCLDAQDAKLYGSKATEAAVEALR